MHNATAPLSYTKPIVAASLLSANAAHYGQDIQQLQDAGIDWLHLDVMDGHFVPNLTFGPPIIKALRAHSDLFFDVHLMIEKPESMLEDFVAAGANALTIHVEACKHVHRSLSEIRRLNVQAGICINPGTSVLQIEPILHLVDSVLVMSVNPGWGGQIFLPEILPKIKQLHRWRYEKQLAFHIAVDGGIHEKTAKLCAQQGANVMVAGTSLWEGTPLHATIQAIGQTISRFLPAPHAI